MAALTISKKELVSILGSDGIEVKPGDPIMVRVRNQDFVCRFVGLERGYFVTKTFNDGIESKFRLDSIESCIRIAGINYNLEEA